MPDIPEMDIEEKLKSEKETLGIYVSGHPLDKVKGLYESYVSCNSKDIRQAGTEESELMDEDKVIFAAVVESKKEIFTKRNDKMAFMRVDDKYGSVETVLFGKVYEKFEQLTEDGSLIMVHGKVNARDEKEPVVLVDKLEPLDASSLSKKLYLRITSANKDKLNDALSLAKRNRGEIPVLLYFEEEKVTKKTDMEYWVKDTYELSNALNQLLGKENVKYVSKS
jgi:DNA polymerase-3 subunit alpha